MYFFKVIAVCIAFLFPTALLATTDDHDYLTSQVTENNAKGDFEQTILLLENVLEDKNSNAFDKYHAYFLKYITYKTLLSYDKAKRNLDLAYEIGMQSEYKELVEAQILIERLIVAFDLLEFDQVDHLLKQVTPNTLSYISKRTTAYYYITVAIVEARHERHEQALAYLEQAATILHESYPIDLPLVYRKKIDLYRIIKKYDLALQSFEQGLYYAKKYNTDLYILNMYYDMVYFYTEIGFYHNALQMQEICDQLAKEYDEGSVVGRLNILENQLQHNRLQREQRQELLKMVLIATVFIVLSSVLVILYRYLRKSKKLRNAIKQENDLIRGQLIDLLTHDESDKVLAIQKAKLTKRQASIVELVKKGKTNKEIGSVLFISENTVKYHLKNIYEVLSVNSRVDL